MLDKELAEYMSECPVSVELEIALAVEPKAAEREKNDGDIPTSPKQDLFFTHTEQGIDLSGVISVPSFVKRKKYVMKQAIEKYGLSVDGATLARAQLLSVALKKFKGGLRSVKTQTD
jgi:hypothetical protein